MLISGELDIATAPGFEAAVKQSIDAGRLTVLDLANVEFMDCVALAALLRAVVHAKQSHRELVIRATVSSPVRRLWDLTMVTASLPIDEAH